MQSINDREEDCLLRGEAGVKSTIGVWSCGIEIIGSVPSSSTIDSDTVGEGGSVLLVKAGQESGSSGGSEQKEWWGGLGDGVWNWYAADPLSHCLRQLTEA